MREPGDIPDVSPEPAPGPEPALVWLVGGEERPFEPAGEARRPWLEESTEWAAGEHGRDDGPDAPDAPPELVWV